MSPTDRQKSLWRHGALALVGAVAVNLIILAIGTSTDASFLVPNMDRTGEMEVNAGPVITFTVVPVLLALLIASFAAARPARLRIVAMVTVGLFALSLIAPLTVDSDGGTRLSLAAMHLAPAAAVLWALRAASGTERIGGDVRDNAGIPVDQTQHGDDDVRARPDGRGSPVA